MSGDIRTRAAMRGSVPGPTPLLRRAVPEARWVERFAIVLFTLVLLYVMFGTPGDDPTDTAQTDHVSPLNSLIWMSFLALSMPVLMKRWREVLALTLGAWPLLVLFSYFALSVTWALDPSASLRRVVLTVVQLAILAILVSGIRHAPRVHIVIATVCSVAALADLAAWILIPGTAMAADGFAGLQGQKNQAGLLIMYGCLAAAPCIWLVRHWIWKGCFAGSCLIMAVLLVATRSTTSESVVLSAVIFIPVILLIAQLPRSLILAIVATAILLLLCAAFGYLAWCGLTGLDPMLPLRGATFTERKDIWDFVVTEIQKRPWLGAGYSSFWSINPAVQPSLKTDSWFSLYVVINEGHEGYLDQLATGGIIGLLGSLFVLFRAIIMAGLALNWTQKAPAAWRAGLMSRPTAVFHLSLLVGLIIHNFTESNLFTNNSVLAVAFLIAMLDLERWRITVRATGRVLDTRIRVATVPMAGARRA
jgi:exopolysaccharide production protein ExoQ